MNAVVSDRPVSDRVLAATASLAPVQDFYFNSRYAARRGQPGVCDFTFGNPQEFPLPGLVQALHRHADRSEEHTSELPSLMRIPYAVFRLKKQNKTIEE